MSLHAAPTRITPTSVPSATSAHEGLPDGAFSRGTAFTHQSSSGAATPLTVRLAGPSRAAMGPASSEGRGVDPGVAEIACPLDEAAPRSSRPQTSARRPGTFSSYLTPGATA